MLGARLGCSREPFRISPDSSSLYISSQQSSIYKTLLESVEARSGLLVLLGEAGLGKTGVMLRLYDELRGKGARVAFLRNGAESFRDVATSCARQMEIALPEAEDIPVTVAFTNYLIGAGGLLVILIDEAHGLSGKLLRQLGHLANLEGDQGTLVQIVLSGYPSLQERLRVAGVEATPALYVELEPLSPEEIGSFIHHYLRVAECERDDLFPPESIQRIARYSKGVPRQINALCRNAVVIADLRSEPVITPDMIDEAARDLDLVDKPTRSTIAEAFQPAPAPPARPAAARAESVPERPPPARPGTPVVAPAWRGGQAEPLDVPGRDEAARPPLRRTVWRAMSIAAGLFGIGLLGWTGVVLYHRYLADGGGASHVPAVPRVVVAPPPAVEADGEAATGTIVREPVDPEPASGADSVGQAEQPEEPVTVDPSTVFETLASYARSAYSDLAATMREPAAEGGASEAATLAASGGPDTAEPAVTEAPAQAASGQPPVLEVANVETREDEPAVLPVAIGGDADLENLEVRIAGLPKAAKLSSGRRIPGGWAVDAVELEGLTVTMPEHRSGQFPLKVSLLDAITGETIQSAEIDLRIEPVPDTPQLTVSAADGDQYTAIPIQIFGWLVDHDGSEKLHFYIDGVPAQSTLSAGKRLQNGRWLLTAADLKGLVLTPMQDAPPELELQVGAVSTERGNGAQAVATRTVKIRVFPGEPPAPKKVVKD